MLKVSTVATFWQLDSKVPCGGCMQTANTPNFKAEIIGCMTIYT